MLSCSQQKVLVRKYEGEGREKLLREMGEPNRIISQTDGKQWFIYRKETAIRETVIGTGSYTPDPRISPGFLRIETYRFLIDQNGAIEKVNYEKQTQK
jgi:hypothetical protein